MEKDLKYSKICPTCGERIFYKTRGSYWANKNKKSPCKDCKHKIHSEIMSGRHRPPFSQEWRKNISRGHKSSDIWKQSMNTQEYKEKHRRKMIHLIKENKTKVGYNKKACPVFDYINKQLGWSGVHAENGKERSVDVFFLDYYEPSLNIAIEWDEKHHRKPSRHKADWIKQKIVIDTIGCEFYRIDEASKTVKKIDKFHSDKSYDIQRILNEYYESEKQRRPSSQL